MNKNLARIYCLFLALLISVAVFSGCNKTDEEDNLNSSSPDDVTSIEQPAVIEVTSDGYEIAEGTNIVTVIKDNETSTTTMMVATDTACRVFKEAVKAKDGYTYKIVDTNGNEITNDVSIIENGYKFVLYKNGVTESIETYTISVVTKEKIESTISEVKAEQSRYESQLAEQSSDQAASQESSQEVINSDITSDGRSNADVSSTNASGITSVVESPLNGYSFGIYSDYEINKLWLKKFDEIEYKYNFSIDEKSKFPFDDGLAHATVLENADMVGEKYADVVVTKIDTARELAKSGLLADFKLATNLDLNASYFNSAISDGLTFQGKTYAVSLTSMGTAPMGVTFNKDLISLNAPDYDIYQMYKDGTWTADAFTEILKACSKNLDSNPSTYEIYGMTSNTNVIGIALSSFAGGTAAKDISTGYVYPCFTTDAGIQSLDWCKNVYRNNYWKYNADIYEAINFFATGNAATVITYMWAVKQAASSAIFKIGFVPFPKSGNQTDYVTQTYDCPVFIVPKTNEVNMDKVGAFINALAEINDEAVDLSVKEYNDVGLDEVGCSVFRRALTNTTLDLSSDVYSGSISTAIDTSVTSASKEPVSEMAAIADQAVAETDDYYGVLTGQGK